jgi:hypothetical protein
LPAAEIFGFPAEISPSVFDELFMLFCSMPGEKMAGGKLRKWRKNSISRRICKNEQNIQKMTNKNGHLSKENLREFACNLNSFRIFGQNVYLKAIFYVVLPKNSGGGLSELLIL